MKLNHPFFIAAFHVLFLLLLVILGEHAAIGDWGNYYYGSTAFGEGIRTEIYDPVFFNNYVEAQGAHHFFLSYTQVPPISLLIYFPFTFLKAGIAKLVFTSLTYLFCAFSVTRLFKKLQLDLRWSLLLPVIFLLPLKSNVEPGQSYLLILALLSEGWMAKEQKKYFVAGICFALSIHLKIFPAIVLLWLLFEKDRKTLGATLLAVVVLFIASLPFIHWETWRMYVIEILPRLAKGEINNAYATSYQSLQVLLKQLFVPDKLHNPNTWVDAPYLYTIGNITWRGIVLVIALLFTFDKKYSSLFRFSFWLLAGILVSGYGSSYGLLQLIFLVIAIFSLKEISTLKKATLLVCIGIIANLPVHLFFDLSFPFNFPRLLILLCLLSLLVFILRPRWNSFSLFSLLFCAPLIFGSGTGNDSSEYVLKTEPSLLITDFFVRNDSLIYHFRDKNGMHESGVAFNEKIETAEELKNDAHTIYLERPWYFQDERIENPMLINDKALIYLSDRGRGVGFYTIRKRIAGKNAGKY
ncbi:hypothetical protein BH11BAC7_BH11BAC7_08490 [soil metagenome]